MRDPQEAGRLAALLKSASGELRACRRCGSLPTLTYETTVRSDPDKYNVGHFCSDGMVSRGARGTDLKSIVSRVESPAGRRLDRQFFDTFRRERHINQCLCG